MSLGMHKNRARPGVAPAGPDIVDSPSGTGPPGQPRRTGWSTMNEAQVVLAGYVAREPRFRKTHNGYSYTSLRVGYTPRRMDRDSGEWSDGGTSFVTVFCWRGLAENVAMCVRKGDPVLVKGKLQVRPYTDKAGASRVAVEVEASSIGHDLTRGVAMFQRALRPAGETALERAAGVAPPGEAGADEVRPAGPAAGDGIQGMHRLGCSPRTPWPRWPGRSCRTDPTARTPRTAKTARTMKMASRRRIRRSPGRAGSRWGRQRHSDRDPRKALPGGPRAPTLLPSVIARPLLEHGM